MSGNLVREEPTALLNSFLERNNANHVSRATSVLSLILPQLQGNVMLDFSVIMALTNNNHLVATRVTQVYVQVDDIVRVVTH